MKLTIQTTLPDAKAWMGNVQKQTTFAAAVALTRTAQDVRDAEGKEMARAFDRPTPYTMRSLFLKPATRNDLTATVWLKDDRAGSGTPAVNYLLPQIQGGPRRLKRFEKALQLSGNMPNGWYAVPGAGARLDQYGNISVGQIIQILSQLRVQLVAGSSRNMSLEARKQIAAQRKAGGRFFVIKPGTSRAPPGIYLREFIGRNITPVIIFVRRVTFKPRFKFFEVGQRVAEQRFPAHFEREMQSAMRTAR